MKIFEFKNQSVDSRTQRHKKQIRRFDAIESVAHRPVGSSLYIEQPEKRASLVGGRFQARVSAHIGRIFSTRFSWYHRSVRTITDSRSHHHDARTTGHGLLYVPNSAQSALTRRLQTNTRLRRKLMYVFFISHITQDNIIFNILFSLVT